MALGYNSRPFSPEAKTMRATARAQPNIALIKYWGKRDTDRNLPAVGSISITLADLYTEMAVADESGLDKDVLEFDGRDNVAMLPRVSQCLDSIAGKARPRLRVSSSSNFPVAAGLASSASAFAALTVATNAALDCGHNEAELASLAGRASGSAARSLLGGFVELANQESDIEIASLLAAEDWPLEVVIAITAPGPKPVSSGKAMEISRATSPFYGRWIEQQPADLDEARDAITTRDFAKLGAVAEHNCLKMHSVMWGSRPPIVFWNSATLACMQTIRELQADGVDVFFTIDAGPQLKAVCMPETSARVREALTSTVGVRDIVLTGLGPGAALVSRT